MNRLYSFALLAVWVAAPHLNAQQGRLNAQQRRPEIVSNLINDVDEAAVALHPATPYLEATTLLLVDVDLSKIDFDATTHWLQSIRPGEEPAVQMARAFVQSLQGAGAERILATASIRTLIDGGPLVVVPSPSPSVVFGLVSGIVQNFPGNLRQKALKVDEAVLAGAATVVDRVAERDGTERPDLILPMRVAERLDHSAVISLPDEVRQSFADYWPERLPGNPPIQFSPRELVGDVTNIFVTLRLPPDPRLRIHIKTTGIDAAGRVEELLDKVVLFGKGIDATMQSTVDSDTVKLDTTPEAFARIVAAMIAPARRKANQMATSNSMKQIGLAIHSYFAKEKRLPPRALTDARGNPLHSIRVALLPYVEQAALFSTIKLDQAWDSEPNRMATGVFVPVYCGDADHPAMTRLRFPVFPGSLWDANRPARSFRDVRDGTANTIVAIEAPTNDAVAWADPRPWTISPDSPLADLFGDRDTVVALFLDGTARVLERQELSDAKLKAMLTYDGGEWIE